VAGADVATIADQSLERLGGRTSILARQRADHARLDRLMARARTTVQEGGIAHQVALRAVARLVFTHAFAEESVLFPAARRVLPEGDPLTLRIETDHQEVDELVARLDRSSWSDPGHRELMERTFRCWTTTVWSAVNRTTVNIADAHGPRRPAKAISPRNAPTPAAMPKCIAHIRRRTPGSAAGSRPRSRSAALPGTRESGRRVTACSSFSAAVITATPATPASTPLPIARPSTAG